MLIYSALILGCWFVFIAVWFISAFTAKKTIRDNRWRQFIYVRLGIVAVIILFLRLPWGQSTFQHSPYIFISMNPVILSLGVVLCMAGVAFAIWARFYLGRNWGMPMTRKENRELVTSGPYAYVRHPIYTGMLTAIIGSLLVDCIFWLVPLVFASAYFIYSATTEEKMMTQEFPDQYPAYKARTKMLIPFVF
jgi:protein-S-isoprenylcysteine O-methyltransferase Ste14